MPWNYCSLPLRAGLSHLISAACSLEQSRPGTSRTPCSHRHSDAAWICWPLIQTNDRNIPLSWLVKAGEPSALCSSRTEWPGRHPYHRRSGEHPTRSEIKWLASRIGCCSNLWTAIAGRSQIRQPLSPSPPVTSHKVKSVQTDRKSTLYLRQLQRIVNHLVHLHSRRGKLPWYY